MPPKRVSATKSHDNVTAKKLKTIQMTLIQTPTNDSHWKTGDSLLIYTHPDVKPSSKILAMDMDNTVITTASGRTFPVDCNDWKLFADVIPAKLKHYLDRGFKIVIISNQYGIAKGHVKVADFKVKIESLVKRVGVPMQAFFSMVTDHNRKPDTGMWECLVQEQNQGVAVDLSSSLYCGDAAGRPVEGKRKKDHSCGDRLFALNLSLSFLTPEQLWFDVKDPGPFSLPAFNPSTLLAPLTNSSALPALSPPTKIEIVVLVGFPGAGKSHFCQHVIRPLGYTVVNRDTLGTWQKCVKACEEALRKDQSVVIDNTNVDVESRARYIQVARRLACPVRCFVMETTFEQAKHNERFRSLTVKTHTPIKDMVFNMSRSKYQEPTIAEGFSEILRIPFVLDRSMENRSVYCKFLLDK